MQHLLGSVCPPALPPRLHRAALCRRRRPSPRIPASCISIRRASILKSCCNRLKSIALFPHCCHLSQHVHLHTSGSSPAAFPSNICLPATIATKALNPRQSPSPAFRLKQENTQNSRYAPIRSRQFSSLTRKASEFSQSTPHQKCRLSSSRSALNRLPLLGTIRAASSRQSLPNGDAAASLPLWPPPLSTQNQTFFHNIFFQRFRAQAAL